MKRFFPIFCALWMMMRTVWFLPSLDNAFYIFISISLIAILINQKNETITIDKTWLIIIGVCTLSIIFNDIPQIFRPWPRLFLWIVIISFAGPFINNKYLCKCRICLFQYLQYIFAFIVVISFFGRFIGITRYEGIYFKGIASNSILFGIITANFLVVLTNFIAQKFSSLNRTKQWLLEASVLIVILMLFASSSRSALISGTVGTLPILAEFAKQKSSILLSFILLVLFLFLLATPIIDDYTIGIRQKNLGQITSLDFSSREELWDESIIAFKGNPILGVGFSAISTEDDDKVFGSGRVETGNSWLSILAMTGVCGGAAVIAILGRAAFQLIDLFKGKVPQASLLCGMLLCYMFHMCSEGYIYAGGSVLCLNFWLTLGTITAFHELNPVNSAANLSKLSV